MNLSISHLPNRRKRDQYYDNNDDNNCCHISPVMMYLVIDLGYNLRISLLELDVRHHLPQQGRLHKRVTVTITQTTREVMLLALIGC